VNTLFWVALGGAVGSAARYGVVQATARVFGFAFPWGTLIVNVTGSFVMGLVTYYLLRKTTADEPLRWFLTTGVLGGYTTFSAFSFDAMTLMQRGEQVAAAGYILASVLISLLAVFAGFAIARMVMV
jgi:fluoride exporter